MDIWAIIGIVGLIVGIIAGIVQVLDYLDKRREANVVSPMPIQPLASSRSQKVSTFQTSLQSDQLLNNLPPRHDFIGREQVKDTIHEALKSRLNLIVIEGMGGIGKSSLALEVAYECLQASKRESVGRELATFIGFIWITAKDAELSLNGLLDTVARTLEYPGIAKKGLDEKLHLVRKLLQSKPYLLIVDNFETVEDQAVKDFLLDLPEPSRALVTTREQRFGRGKLFTLKGLNIIEAEDLIKSEATRLGLSTSIKKADKHIISEIIQTTGGIPLAIKWILGQVKQKGQAIDFTLDELQQAKGKIFEQMFARSWSLLSEDAQAILMIMPLFTTPVSRIAIEAISNVHDINAPFGQLVEMSLLETTNEIDSANQRYSIHSLTRSFAHNKLIQREAYELEARERWVNFYYEFAKRYGGYWNQTGFAQLDIEIPNFFAVLDWCWANNKNKIGIEIFIKISDNLIVRGYWIDALTKAQKALDQANLIGNKSLAARLHNYPLGWLYRHLGNLDLAEKHVLQALSIANDLDENERLLAVIKRNLARIYHEQGQFEESKQLFHEILPYFESVDDNLFICTVNLGLAKVALEQAELDIAWNLSNKGLTIARELDDAERIGSLLEVLGEIAFRQGDFSQAENLWQENLQNLQRAIRLDGQADTLRHLAILYLEQNRFALAQEMLLNALDIYEQLHMEFRVNEVKELLQLLK